MSRRLSPFFRAHGFWFSQRHVFRNIFRGCCRGKLPVNDGAHEYLNAFLHVSTIISACFRRCFRGSNLTHSFRRVFARLSRVEVLLSRGGPHMNPNTTSFSWWFLMLLKLGTFWEEIINPQLAELFESEKRTKWPIFGRNKLSTIQKH